MFTKIINILYYTIFMILLISITLATIIIYKLFYDFFHNISYSLMYGNRNKQTNNYQSIFI